MTVLLLTVAAVSFLAQSPVLSGRVLDAQGQPIAGARVFLEPGLVGALLETKSAPDGTWRFESPAQENAGIFAVAEGSAFGGFTVTAAGGQDTDIRLAPSASVGGKVVDAKGHPVQGARVTRVALLGTAKVGIPLAKLKALGFEEPVSDAKGAFTVARLPEGGKVALKVAHPDYAQEGVVDIDAGSADVRVTLYSGVVVRGEVLSREGQKPVADTTVIVRNAQPPHDTMIAKSDGTGSFVMRLKPGVYMYQASSAAWRSAGWNRLAISGEESLPRLKVFVAGAGRIKGSVRDAITEKPIPNAKIALETEGNMAAVTRSNASGEFVLDAMAGQNAVRVEAAPGYLPPDQATLRITAQENKDTVLPTFWLAPIPVYPVQVVDENGKPVAGVVVSVLRPQQFGWTLTDQEGRVALRFGSVPADGTLVAMAEHVTKPLGALFSIKAREKREARVQLLPLGSIRGRVSTGKNKPLEGAVVGALLGKTDIPIWRTLATRYGNFQWSAVVPQVEQRCVAFAGDKAFGESATFSIDGPGDRDIGNVIAPEGEPGVSMLGKNLPWYDNPLLGGPLPPRAKSGKRAPAVVIYCNAQDAPLVIEALTVARQLFEGESVEFAAVVDGDHAAQDATVPVFRGQAPGRATTYITGADNRVVLETFGMPPLHAIQEALAPPAPSASPKR